MCIMDNSELLSLFFSTFWWILTLQGYVNRASIILTWIIIIMTRKYHSPYSESMQTFPVLWHFNKERKNLSHKTVKCFYKYRFKSRYHSCIFGSLIREKTNFNRWPINKPKWLLRKTGKLISSSVHHTHPIIKRPVKMLRNFPLSYSNI